MKVLPQSAQPSFHPMPGRIVVKLLQEENVGSLWLPDGGKLRVMGEVIAVGGDEADGDLDFPVAVGDVVLFGANSGVRVRVGREEVLVFRTSEILCTVTWDEENSEGATRS